MRRNRRQQIIDLASEKFYKYGFYKVSMDSLVDELRISKSTLYKYFTSKEELVRAVIQNYTSTVDKKFEALIDDDTIDIFDKMVAFTRFYGYMLTQVSDDFLRDVELLMPHLWEQEVDLRISRFTDYFGKIFDMGVNNGLFRPELNKSIVVFLYIKMTEIVYTKHLDQFQMTRKEAFSHISDLFLQGMLTPSGQEELKRDPKR